MTSDAIRLGNLLYVWMHCHRRRAEGEDVRALANADTPMWDALWSLTNRRLVVRREEMRVWDRREELPDRLHQVFGVDYTREDIEVFVREVLLGPPFRSLLKPDLTALTVNVRRGDYYANPDFRSLFAFDYPGYLRAALDLALEQGGRPGRIKVVSDDPAWCRDNLGWLTGITSHVEIVEHDPASNLALLAASQRLILTNSTFSYWGGYISRSLHPSGAGAVVAPRFHRRDLNGGAGWQLDPEWTIVDGFW
jgi:hypothetical protein